MNASQDTITRGADVYFRNCAVCHGVNGEVRAYIVSLAHRAAE